MLNQMESDIVMDLMERAKQARLKCESLKKGTIEWAESLGQLNAFEQLDWLIQMGEWAPLKKKAREDRGP